VNVRFARRAMRSHAMSYNGGRPRLPPFPPDYRASGVLLHVTSLPSRYGVGDVGPAALEWIDRLRDAGQAWWQALPLGPTGYGDSPYQPQSSFAGNEILISPDWLIEDGLLRARDVESRAFSATAGDYDAVLRFPRLERRVGEPRAISAGRASPATLRSRSAPRLLQQRRTALGKSRLRLGRPSADRLPLVHRPTACPPGSCGCDSPGPFPGVRRCLARAGQGVDGSVRAVDSGPGCRVLRRSAERAGRPTVHRRGPRADHARRPRAPRSVPPARDAGPPVRFRRPSRQSPFAGQLRS